MIDHSLLPLLVSAGISDSRIARHYSVSSRTVLRWRIAEGLVSAWVPPRATFEHGTTSRYGQGCRCEACRGASAERQGRLRAERAKRNPPPSVKHGLSAARNWACKCEVCRAATAEWNRTFGAAWQKEQQAITKAFASRDGQPWTPDELRTAARTDLTIRQIALHLGRSRAAINAIRRRLAAGEFADRGLAA